MQPSVVPLHEAGSLDPALVGGKAAGLAQLLRLGLRVPPGSCSRPTCAAPSAPAPDAPGVVDAVDEAVAALESATGREYGGDGEPLLLAVRSGAAVPMPGMMDTVLDVGFGRGPAPPWRPRAARPSPGAATPASSPTTGTWCSVPRCRPPMTPTSCAALLGERVPVDPRRQLLDAVAAVLRSWSNPVLGPTATATASTTGSGPPWWCRPWPSATGGRPAAAASRRAATPGREPPACAGTSSAASHGVDVVDGAHRSRPLAELADVSPGAHAELERAVRLAEAACRDLVDVEFAVEEGDLHVLQLHAGIRAAAAAVRIAVDLVDEGVIDVAQALARVTTAQLGLAARPTVAPGAGVAIGTGLGACPGVATGRCACRPTGAAEPRRPARPGAARDLSARHPRTDGQRRSAHRPRRSGQPRRTGGAGAGPAHGRRRGGPPDRRGRATHPAWRARPRGGCDHHRGRWTGHVHAGRVEVVAAAPSTHLARFRAWSEGRIDPS